MKTILKDSGIRRGSIVRIVPANMAIEQKGKEEAARRKSVKAEVEKRQAERECAENVKVERIETREQEKNEKRIENTAAERGMTAEEKRLADFLEAAQTVKPLLEEGAAKEPMIVGKEMSVPNAEQADDGSIVAKRKKRRRKGRKSGIAVAEGQ